MDEPQPPDLDRLRWNMERARKRMLAKQQAKVKVIQRNARDGVKHAVGSTKPPREVRRSSSRKRSKGAKASRRRNR